MKIMLSRTLPYGTNYQQMLRILQQIDAIQKGGQQTSLHKEKNLYKAIEALQFFGFSKGLTLTAQGKHLLTADPPQKQHIILSAVGRCFAYNDILRRLFEKNSAADLSISQLAAFLLPYHKATTAINQSAALLLANLLAEAGLADINVNTGKEAIIEWHQDARLRLIEIGILQHTPRPFLPYGSNYQTMEKLLLSLKNREENIASEAPYLLPSFFNTHKALQYLGLVEGYGITEKGYKVLLSQGAEKHQQVLNVLIEVPAYRYLFFDLLETHQWSEIYTRDIEKDWLMYNQFKTNINEQTVDFFVNMMEWAGLGTMAQVAGGEKRIKWEKDARQRVEKALQFKNWSESIDQPSSALSGLVSHFLTLTRQGVELGPWQQQTLNHIQHQDFSLQC
ncbi:MAG TPA: hypothetical protein GX404_09835 [Syntrophomonadaceae bacterium]|nr:hypothetical protein [Syntrophomonadaceae bacterium]